MSNNENEIRSIRGKPRTGGDVSIIGDGNTIAAVIVGGFDFDPGERARGIDYMGSTAPRPRVTPHPDARVFHPAGDAYDLATKAWSALRFGEDYWKEHVDALRRALK